MRVLFYFPANWFWATGKGALLIVVQLLSVIAGIGPLILILNMPGNFPTAEPLALLSSMLSWYKLLVFAGYAAIALVVVINIVCIVVTFRNNLGSLAGPVIMMIIAVGLTFLCAFVMLIDEDVQDLMENTKADIELIESGGDLVTIRTSILRIENARVPGPYSSYVEEQPVASLRVNDPDSLGYLSLRYPREMRFSYDEKRFFSDRISIDANEERVQHFRITYTPNMRMVVSIEALD